MQLIGTPNNNDVSRNLLTISGDPALAHFAGTSAVFSPADSFSSIFYNGLASPSAFLDAVNLNDSPLMQGIKGLSVQDIWNLVTLSTGVPNVAFPDSAVGQAVIKGTKETAAAGISNLIDWEFWLVSIFLALLGLLFVAGGVLSFR